MKNVIYGLCSTLLLTLLCLIPSPSFADECEDETTAVQVIKACHVEVGPGLSGPQFCPASSIPVELDKDGLVFVNAKVFVADVDGQTINGDYLLPVDVPRIYMRFTYKDDSTTQLVGPFESYAYDPNFQPTSDSIYNCTIPVTLDLSDFLCKDEENDTSHIIRFVELKMELLSPVKGSPGVYQEYPIHDYSGPGELFTCSTFQETCYDCANPACDSLLAPIYDEYLCFDCQGTELPDQSPDKRQKQDLANGLSWESQINPNPFDQQVNLQINAKDAINLDLEIYNAMGQLVKNQQESWGIGGGQKSISTADLAPGIYYFHLKDGQKTVTHKLVKLGL